MRMRYSLLHKRALAPCQPIQSTLNPRLCSICHTSQSDTPFGSLSLCARTQTALLPATPRIRLQGVPPGLQHIARLKTDNHQKKQT